MELSRKNEWEWDLVRRLGVEVLHRANQQGTRVISVWQAFVRVRFADISAVSGSETRTKRSPLK